MKPIFIVLIVLAVVIVALIAAVAIAFIAMKNKGICPLCFIKQFTKRTEVTLELPEENYNNGVAQTPPMGWSTWNTFRQNINEDIIRDSANAIKECGLLDAGYEYINLDDCWHSSLRDDKGRLQGDLTNFPSGMKKLVKDINELGFKLGLYSSNGTLTCEDLPASLGHEDIDALTFALWGVEFFKYDFCHNVPLPKDAPMIEGISIGIPSSGQVKNFYAKDAVLEGRAKVIQDKKLPSGEYIGFLGHGSGKATFNVNVEEDGEYVLTLLIKKALLNDKYLQIHIGDTMYETIVPGTKSWSPTGRHQLIISLKAGTNAITMYNPIATNADSAFVQYHRMGKALKKATSEIAKVTNKPEKPILFSICEWGRNHSWNWAAKAGNIWRTTPDIMPMWSSILLIYNHNVKLNQHSSIGAWNDPDMLEVGNGKLTYDENKTHFTMWCMMSAPLILGNDVRKFIKEDGTVDTENETLKIVTNPDLIAIDQDRMGVPAKRMKCGLLGDILAKPLANGDCAIAFINKGKIQTSFTFDIDTLADDDIFRIEKGGQYNFRELWTGAEQDGNVLKASCGAHECKVYRVSRIN